VKRRLEEKEAEEQNKRQCAEYYFLKIQTQLTRRTAGIRATLYGIVDEFKAVWYTKDALFYTQEENEVVLSGVGRCCDVQVRIVVLLPLLLSRGFLHV
jgi:hypothetical protein